MSTLTQDQKWAIEERADRVSSLIDIARTRQYLDGDDDHTDLTDLLANMMHWADQQGVDFYHALQTGQMHYNAEKNGEP